MKLNLENVSSLDDRGVFILVYIYTACIQTFKIKQDEALATRGFAFSVP